MNANENMAEAAHEAATCVYEFEYKDLPFEAECDICGDSLKSLSKYNRNIHRISHFGRKIFFCDRCKNRYRRADSLRKHLTTAHNITSKEVQTIIQERLEKQYYKVDICETCKKTFARSYSLKWHMKVSKIILLLIRH